MNRQEIIKKRRHFRIIVLASVIVSFILLVLTGYGINWRNCSRWRAFLDEEKLEQKSLKNLEKGKNKLWKKIVRLSPKGIYIVIDTARNMLYIKKDSSVLLEALISCGSGNILEDPAGRRKWVFDTPRGTFFVTSKVKNPSWIKPDWAFIEEGETVPEDPKKRIETGVLGDYALGFGNGYFIHGTLYTRLLGRNVTHGCIRVGDKDLEHLFHTASVGTVIFIF